VNALTTLDAPQSSWSYDSWDENQLTEAQWSLLEQQGAVFLPAAGDRQGGTSIYSAGTAGTYWSSTYRSTHTAYCMHFFRGTVHPQYGFSNCNGYSVRLVSDVTTSGNFNNQPFGVTPNP
jgi:hypothetical protein